MESFDFLSEIGIDPIILNQYQILCLPENIGDRSKEIDLADSGESIILSKLLKEEGVKCANSYDIGLTSKVIERRGLSDIWLGYIWIRDHAIFPILISVVSRLLADKVSKQLKALQGSEESKETKVHATLKVLDGKTSAEVVYVGDADTFLKVLKGINDDQSSSTK